MTKRNAASTLTAGRLAARGAVFALALPFLFAADAAADDICHFVEVQCDKAAKVVRIVPFAAMDQECGRLRALKDADWLVDVAKHVRGTGKDAMLSSGAAKTIRCELAPKRAVVVKVEGSPVKGGLTGPCGAMFSAIVAVDEVEPAQRRVVKDLNLLADCASGGAADRIEYFVETRKLLVEWSKEPQFGALERTILARRYLADAERGRR